MEPWNCPKWGCFPSSSGRFLIISMNPASFSCAWPINRAPRRKALESLNNRNLSYFYGLRAEPTNGSKAILAGDRNLTREAGLANGECGNHLRQPCGVEQAIQSQRREDRVRRWTCGIYHILAGERQFKSSREGTNLLVLPGNIFPLSQTLPTTNLSLSSRMSALPFELLLALRICARNVRSFRSSRSSRSWA